MSRKVAIITGASSGIGAETAKVFSEQGYSVVAVSRDESKLKTLMSELSSDCSYYCCDVSSETQVEDFEKWFSREYDRLDVLVNNAGVIKPSCEIERMPIPDWEDTFKINVEGAFLMCRSMKKHLCKSHGSIVNNASIAGLHSYVIGRSYAYSASKSALIQFSRQMAKNYGEEGVRVNCICPGIIETPMLGDRDRTEYAKRVPLGYIGNPKEVANVVAFLASDMASYVTGAVIPVDGGVQL